MCAHLCEHYWLRAQHLLFADLTTSTAYLFIQSPFTQSLNITHISANIYLQKGNGDLTDGTWVGTVNWSGVISLTTNTNVRTGMTATVNGNLGTLLSALSQPVNIIGALTVQINTFSGTLWDYYQIGVSITDSC